MTSWILSLARRAFGRREIPLDRLPVGESTSDDVASRYERDGLLVDDGGNPVTIETMMVDERDIDALVEIVQIERTLPPPFPRIIEAAPGGNDRFMIVTAGAGIDLYSAAHVRRPAVPVAVRIAQVLFHACDIVSDALASRNTARRISTTFPALVTISKAGIEIRSPIERPWDSRPLIAGRPRSCFYMMPPEVIRGYPAGPQSAQFSVAAALYALATGAHPFLAPSEFETLERVRNVDLPARLEDIFDHDLALVLARMFERDAAKRFPTSADACAALDRFAASDEEVSVWINEAVKEIVFSTATHTHEP